MKRILGIVIAASCFVALEAEPASARTCSSFVPECKRIVVAKCRATGCSKWQMDYAPIDCDRYQQQCVASGIWQGPPNTMRGVERR
jgi:hypothetical protein